MIVFFLMYISVGPDEFGLTQGLVPLAGHSLSWKNEKDNTIGPNNKLVAKIWTPSDPRRSDNDRKTDTYVS